ncbi:MAG: hypothetical protein ACKV0T_07900 [Planctomycetales bacterium]
MTLVCDPLISSSLWGALAAVAAGLLAWYAWRRPFGMSRVRWVLIVAFMGTAASLLLVILLNPTWLEVLPPPAGKPRLEILVDDSASMAAADMPDGETRYAAAVKVATASAAALGDRFEVRVSTFSKTRLPCTLEQLAQRAPGGMLTDLATALASAVETSHPAGQAVLLLSDGNHNAGGGTPQVLAALTLVRAADAPVYTKTFGSDAETHDLAVRLHAAQQVAFVGQSVPLTALVRRRGRAPEGVTVILTHQGEEVDRQQVYLSGDVETEVRFQVQQETKGLYRYEVRVDPFEGEVTQVNNYGTFLLRVVDEPMRVLLVEGKPYWDAKFLARTLSSDPSIEFVSVVRMAEGRFLERTLKRIRPEGAADDKGAAGAEGVAGAKGVAADSSQAGGLAAIPVTESWRVLKNGADVLADAGLLRTYQVLVLGRDAEVFLSDEAIDNVRNWVSGESGAVVCYRGQPMAQVGERLERMLPIQWRAAGETRHRMALTDRGRDMRWFDARGGSASEELSKLPALATSSAVEPPKPLATVLASASDQAGDEIPVVTYQPYGGGRVVVVEGAGMWRWAFLPPAYADHDPAYGTLWQSLLRWLVSGAGLLPGQDMALRADQVTFGSNESAVATLLIRKEALLETISEIELSGEGIDVPRRLPPVAAAEGQGVFRINFGQLPEGRYEARIAGQPRDKSGASTAFDVRRLFDEQLDLRARPDLMARIASSTGGAPLASNSTAQIAEVFLSHLAHGRPDRIRRTPAWDRWWVMLGALTLWTMSWGVRRNSGLV